MNKYLLQSDLQVILKVMYRDLLDVYHNSDHNIEKAIYLGELETIRDCLCKINEAEAADVVERKRGEWVSDLEIGYDGPQVDLALSFGGVGYGILNKAGRWSYFQDTPILPGLEWSIDPVLAIKSFFDIIE